jgi:hypothetical protein
MKERFFGKIDSRLFRVGQPLGKDVAVGERLICDGRHKEDRDGSKT